MLLPTSLLHIESVQRQQPYSKQLEKLLPLNRGRLSIFCLPCKQRALLTTTCHGKPPAKPDPHSQAPVSREAALGHTPAHYGLHSAFRLHRGHICSVELFLRLLGGSVSRISVRGSFAVEVIFSRYCLEAAAPNPSKVNGTLAAVENGGK